MHSDRLILRRMTLADTDDLRRFFGDPRVTEYTDFDPVDNDEKISNLISFTDDRVKNYLGIRWGIEWKETGQIIGSCGFNDWIIERTNRSEIGYDLGFDFWNRGIMTEAVAAILEYGFNTMGLYRIQARMDPDNLGSQRVCEKLGFKREGLIRGDGWWKDAYWDDYMYSKLRTDGKSSL
ncbi:MAG: GNAT family N-acetyltransferase [Promethearchaeota archaeon]